MDIQQDQVFYDKKTGLEILPEEFNPSFKLQDHLETEAASDDDVKLSPTRAELKEQLLQAAVKKERNKEKQQELREELSKIIDLLNTTSQSFEALHQVSVY